MKEVQPIIGHNGRRLTPEKPKADKALEYVTNLANNVQKDFEAFNHRISALEKLCQYMMATNNTEYEELDELTMLESLADFKPAIGLVYYNVTSNTFIRVVPFIDNFELIASTEENQWTAISEKYPDISFEIEAEDEPKAFEELRTQVYEYLDNIYKAIKAKEDEDTAVKDEAEVRDNAEINLSSSASPVK